MDIEAEAKRITGHCVCHGSYTYREMDEPDWRFHKFHADFVDALRKAQDEAYERAAEMCERRYPCGDPYHDDRWCSRCSAFLDCLDLLADAILSLKSKGETK